MSKHTTLLADCSDVGRHARTHGTASPNASWWRHCTMPSHVEGVASGQFGVDLVDCGDREQ